MKLIIYSIKKSFCSGAFLAFLFIVNMNNYAEANCNKVTSFISNYNTSPDGRLGLPYSIPVNSFDAPGTLIASSVAYPAQFGQPNGYPSPETVLYKCDAADANMLFEMYATGRSEAYVGRDEIGTSVGLKHVYATRVTDLGVRIKNNQTGQYFTTKWQSRPLTGLDTDTDGRLLVKVKNFSSITVELFKATKNQPWNASQHQWPIIQTESGVMAFNGPGASSLVVGTDSYGGSGYNAHWPMMIGIAGLIPRADAPTCEVNFVTPMVLIPTINISAITSGETREASFNVRYKCQAGYTAGLQINGVAYGFKPSPSAVNAAIAEGLVGENASVTYLLDNEYNSNTSVAKGVGIRIYRENSPLLLMKDNYYGSGYNYGAQGPRFQGGWYPASGGKPIGDNIYEHTFTARLEKLPGIPVTAGRIRATATFYVRLQ